MYLFAAILKGMVCVTVRLLPNFLSNFPRQRTNYFCSVTFREVNTQKGYPYNFFWTNQRKVDIKIFIGTECEISKDRLDWHILVGNDERIIWHKFPSTVRILRFYISFHFINHSIYCGTSKLWFIWNWCEFLCIKLSVGLVSRQPIHVQTGKKNFVKGPLPPPPLVKGKFFDTDLAITSIRHISS